MIDALDKENTGRISARFLHDPNSFNPFYK